MVRRRVVITFLVVGLIIGGAIGGYAKMHQPHMLAALDHLKDARAQLEMAEHNKGGHRVEAIKLTNAAIEEVKRGMEAGERER